MVATAPALLREWEVLNSRVVPPLLEINETRAPTSWSIGSVEDAVAVGVAFQHTTRSPAGSPMEIYAGGLDGAQPVEMGFTFGDLRSVPDDGLSSYFVRHDRRWVVDEEIAELVFLGDPSDPVDLVTLRSGGLAENRLREVVGQLREGGQLLLRGGADPSPCGVLDELTELSDTAAGLIFRKCGPASEPAVKACASDALVETLALHRTQEELVASHMRLAGSLARRFAHRGESVDDLQQVAMIALVKASKRFDPERDTRFATYATSSILGELKRHFRDKTWMLRVSRPVQELYLEVKQARDDLTHSLGATPSVAQIAEHLGSTQAAVLEAIEAGGSFWPASLEGRTRDDPAIEVPIVDAGLDRSLDRLDLQRLMPGLDSREQMVLRRIYFDDLTQREVAAELGVSQMQVSRLLARSLAKLRP